MIYTDFSHLAAPSSATLRFFSGVKHKNPRPLRAISAQNHAERSIPIQLSILCYLTFSILQRYKKINNLIENTKKQANSFFEVQ
jgi:hypothetical protein